MPKFSIGDFGFIAIMVSPKKTLSVLILLLNLILVWLQKTTGTTIS
jgi:hypothetical protein